MIVHEVEQGTEAWLSLRLGMPTASAFAKVYSSTCKVPKAFDDYCYQLAAEKVTGKRTEVYVNDHMRRGTELEPVAVSAYEFIMDEETEVIGFVTNDEHQIVIPRGDGQDAVLHGGAAGRGAVFHAIGGGRK